MKVLKHHYFGSTAFNWATADTRAEVLAKLAKAAGKNAIDANVKNANGLYAWTVRVELPGDAHYDIVNFAPKDVPVEDAREFNIMNAKGHSLPIDRDTFAV